MKGQIICHIGPPKTATTSMQIALEAIRQEDFVFAGTFQPRCRNAGSWSHRLHDICAGKSGQTHMDQTALKAEVEMQLDCGKTVFLSEEMFLVDQDHASIQEKINALRMVFADLPCRILITARNPSVAIPSYFQEIFRSLPIHLQLNFPAFCRDSRAMCYDYEKLLQILEKAGFEDVFVIDFEALSAGKISLGELTGRKDHAGITLPIEKHNSGLVGPDPTTRMIPRISLKNFGRLRAVQRTINSLLIRKWPGYRHCVALLDRIALRKAAQRELIVPPDVAERLDAGYQRVRQRFLGADV